MEAHDNSLELLKACAKNETEMALKLINSGVNLNIQDSNKTTPLHWCCYNGNDQLTQKLINQKSKQTSDKNGITPLHLAVLSGNSKIVKFLITIDDSLVHDCNGISPLHLAAYCGYNDIVEALTGPYDVNETDKVEITPSHLAASCNHESTVKLLKAKGAELGNQDCFRRLPVHWGAFCGNIEIIKVLAEIEYWPPDHHDNTVLYLATRNSHFDAIKYFLIKGFWIKLEAGINRELIALSNSLDFDDFIDANFDDLCDLPNAIHWVCAFCSVRPVQKWNKFDDLTESRQTVLHTAAAFGNTDVVKYLVDLRVGIDEEDEDFQTPMNWAAAFGYLETVKVLVELGTDKKCSLFWAAANGHIEVADYLIQNGCSVTEEDDDCDYQRTPLMWAATLGQADMIKYLLKLVPNPNDTYDLLHWCAANGLQELVAYLLENGFDVNDSDLCFNRTALHWAAIEGHYEMAKFLIEKGAEVNAIEDQGDRPIHYAVVSNSPEIVKLLIKHGSEINEHGDLEVPILIAIREGYLDIVKILIEAGADLYPEGHDILEAAFSNKQTDLINYLVTKVNTFKNRYYYLAAEYGTLEQLADLPSELINKPDQNGLTLLLHACKFSGNLEIVKYLIEKGENINACAPDGNSVLHRAIDHFRDTELLELLIAKGVDLNATNVSLSRYSDVLTHSIMRGDLDSFNLLLQNGANPNVRNLDGRTPLMFSTKKDIYLEILLNYPVDVNEKDILGQTALHHAIHYGKPANVQLLIKNGADLRIKNVNGDTPLKLALKSLEIVRILIVNGVDVNQLPNLIEANNVNEDVLNILIQAGFKGKNSLKNSQSKPLLLLQLSRIACRNYFGKYYLNVINSYRLPNTVKSYLSYDLIDRLAN